MSAVLIKPWACAVYLAVVPTSTIIITFIVSSLFDSPRLSWPHITISDTIVHKPSNCVGDVGLCLTLPALVLVGMYRHAQVCAHLRDSDVQQVGMERLRRLNTRSLRLIFVALVGASIVVGFTEDMKIFHFSGAVMFFGSTTIWGLLQCTIDRHMYLEYRQTHGHFPTPCTIRRVGILLPILTTLCLILSGLVACAVRRSMPPWGPDEVAIRDIWIGLGAIQELLAWLGYVTFFLALAHTWRGERLEATLEMHSLVTLDIASMSPTDDQLMRRSLGHPNTSTLGNGYGALSVRDDHMINHGSATAPKSVLMDENQLSTAVPPPTPPVASGESWQ